MFLFPDTLSWPYAKLPALRNAASPQGLIKTLISEATLMETRLMMMSRPTRLTVSDRSSSAGRGSIPDQAAYSVVTFPGTCDSGPEQTARTRRLSLEALSVTVTVTVPTWDAGLSLRPTVT